MWRHDQIQALADTLISSVRVTSYANYEAHFIDVESNFLVTGFAFQNQKWFRKSVFKYSLISIDKHVNGLT